MASISFSPGNGKDSTDKQEGRQPSFRVGCALGRKYAVVGKKGAHAVAAVLVETKFEVMSHVKMRRLMVEAAPRFLITPATGTRQRPSTPARMFPVLHMHFYHFNRSQSKLKGVLSISCDGVRAIPQHVRVIPNYTLLQQVGGLELVGPSVFTPLSGRARGGEWGTSKQESNIQTLKQESNI